VGGNLGFDLGAQDIDVVLIHPEIGVEYPDCFPSVEPVERQAMDCGDELAAAVAVLGAVYPTLSDRSADECQGTAATLIGAQPVKRFSPAVLLAHGPTPSGLAWPITRRQASETSNLSTRPLLASKRPRTASEK